MCPAVVSHLAPTPLAEAWGPASNPGEQGRQQQNKKWISGPTWFSRQEFQEVRQQKSQGTFTSSSCKIQTQASLVDWRGMDLRPIWISAQKGTSAPLTCRAAGSSTDSFTLLNHLHLGNNTLLDSARHLLPISFLRNDVHYETLEIQS